MQNQQNGDTTFPVKLTAEMLVGFRTTPRGCTHPREGYIAGRHFIAKCGSWLAYSSDEHVHNEFVADNLLRTAVLVWMLGKRKVSAPWISHVVPLPEPSLELATGAEIKARPVIAAKITAIAAKIAAITAKTNVTLIT